jgi:lysophospholipase L1-like esterase
MTHLATRRGRWSFVRGLRAHGWRLWMIVFATVLAARPTWARAPLECAPVVGAERLWSFFDAARTQRVDVVGLGDSNQAFGGHGWDAGWHEALSDEFGLYATALLAVGENFGNGAGLGDGYQGFSTASTGQFAYSGAPAALDALLSPSVAMQPLNYVYRASGGAGATINWGMTLDFGGPINVNAALRYHLTYGVFDTGSGFFQPAARRGSPPFDQFVAGSVVSTFGGALMPASLTLDLPAGTRNAPVVFRPTPWGVNVVGPFLAYYQRVEQVSRTSGAAFSTLYAWGGQSARDMALGVLSADPLYVALFVSQIRNVQGPGGKILFRINTGLNDRNEALISLGTNPTLPGNSAAAFADNLKAVVERLRGAWVSQGGASEDVYFLITVSHAVSEPDDALLVAYREAAAQVALGTINGAAVDLSKLASADEMLANNWYQSNGFDRNHLTSSGFDALAERELAVLIRPCLGDADGDERVRFSDVTKVLSTFGGCAALPGRGDANGDAVVTFADVTAVLANFGNECD